jgi:hypothetical protein
MNLTKNQIVIVAVLAVGVVAYFMFFRKKPTTTNVVVMPPPATESAYSNMQLDGGMPNGMIESSWAPEYYGPEQLMAGIGTAGASGGTMESSYDDLSAAPTQASLAGIGFNNNWLGY